jgi:mono/diheme cytochrome c family protein
VRTTPEGSRYTITGAPRIVKGKVIIGNAGGEMVVRGYVSAYEADTGKLVWRFYTVPGEPGKRDGAASDQVLRSIARPTWHGGLWWKRGGAGTVWDSIVYDPKLDLLYIGTDNGGPWDRKFRSPAGGDNLFTASIIALKPDTGAYVWHYQTTPGEMWDYSSVQSLVLADLTIDGKLRHIIMQAPKNGFFYVLDRATGQLISAQRFADTVNWAKGIDLSTGRPMFNPEFETGTGMLAPPITYEAGGKQYVAIEVGWGGAFGLAAGELALLSHVDRGNVPRVLAFSLSGADALPNSPPPSRGRLAPRPQLGSASVIAHGKAVYHLYCGTCHGDAAVSGGVLPDLRYSAAAANGPLWQRIVHDGALEAGGMIAFGPELSRAEIESVRAYVVQRINQSAAEQSAAKGDGG